MTSVGWSPRSIAARPFPLISNDWERELPHFVASELERAKAHQRPLIAKSVGLSESELRARLCNLGFAEPSPRKTLLEARRRVPPSSVATKPRGPLFQSPCIESNTPATLTGHAELRRSALRLDERTDKLSLHRMRPLRARNVGGEHGCSLHALPRIAPVASSKAWCQNNKCRPIPDQSPCLLGTFMGRTRRYVKSKHVSQESQQPTASLPRNTAFGKGILTTTLEPLKESRGVGASRCDARGTSCIPPGQT